MKPERGVCEHDCNKICVDEKYCDSCQFYLYSKEDCPLRDILYRMFDAVGHDFMEEFSCQFSCRFWEAKEGDQDE